MKQRNSKQTGRRPADMLDIYKYISSDLCEAYNRTGKHCGKFRRTFLSLQLRSTKIFGWPYPDGKVCVTAWHVTSRNQGLSSNDQGRQRREILGTRLSFKRLWESTKRQDGRKVFSWIPDKCVAVNFSDTGDNSKCIFLDTLSFFGDSLPKAIKRRKTWVDFVRAKRAKWEPTKYREL